MKKIITFLMMLGCIALNAQNSADKFTTGSSDQARDPRVDQMNFVPNEVLVKFKDEVPLSSAVRLRSAGLSAVDKVLQANGIDSLVRLFPNTKNSLLRSAGVARIVKDPQGRDMKIPNLDKIYKITLPQLRSTSSVPVNLFQVIEDLKALPEVEYAEPNYIYSVDDLQPVGPVLTADDVKKMQSGLRSSQSAVVPNDPWYSQQWYIPAVKADLVWEQTTGDTTQVIGILDTGVDWNHPDLKNKIWTNPGEIPGNGIDDDGNGLIDDIRGWDYINNDNNPMDDNSHGTHVAGIAAAETNNGIGIAGICPKAKIMPIKVFQSSGQGDMATIAKGINYAATHGATTINMSFGSYARSLTMEAALSNAYATCVLVASAGNDNIFIGPGLDCKKQQGYPCFPAALSYVLGIGAASACDLGFSNYDDSPIYSDYAELFNYELDAPGYNILSTIPNGNYRVFSGTSMAAPIVSGAVSLYKTKHPIDSQELMWGDLINTAGSAYFDIDSAINVIPKPKLMFVSKTLVDTLPGDNNNNLVDAGETIQLSFMVRNTWGQSDSIYVGLKFGEFEDTTSAQIIKNSAFIGSISPYATRNNDKTPFLIKINPNIENSRDIVFEGLLWFKGSKDTVRQSIVLTASHGTYLSGVMDSTMILSPNYLWLVNNSFRVGSNGYLKILPGTKIIMGSGKFIECRGRIDAIGKPDSLIIFTSDYGNGSGINGGSGIIKYCTFTNLSSPIIWGNYDVEYSKIEGCRDPTMYTYMLMNLSALKNNILQGNIYWSLLNETIHNIIKNNFTKNYSDFFRGALPILFSNTSIIKYNNFIDVQPSRFVYYSSYTPFLLHGITNLSTANTIGNNFLNSNNQKVLQSEGSGDLQNFSNQYWGTADSKLIKDKMYDFLSNASLPQINFNPYLTQPSDSTHGIVWKVLVDGIDPQDQANLMNPIGIGSHRFDVYFNHPMDKTVNPNVSFGVRYPYNQQSVNEERIWSSDGRIYTTYKNVKLTTGDGINRVRVTGAKDLEGWEIPTEDMRFEFLISAASSSSLDFMATPGLGKVKLEWNNNDLADGLGYNMYRMEHINDSTLTAPVIINTSLINDTLYTDYSVIPNRKYYYTYKVVRTDLSETDPSKVVSAIPFTAAKGDANGDLSVNVLDITTIVAHLLNNNPQPFITEAADMNSDGNINVLDIVGVVNKVLYGGLRSVTIVEDQQASLYLQNDTLFADATTAIGGLQFDVNGISSITDIQVLDALQVFESGYSQRDSTTLRLLYYSMSGKSIASGSRIPLLKIKKNCILLNAIVSDKAGASIPVSLSDPTIGNRNGQGMAVAELGQNYPNPSKGQTTLPVQIFEKVDEAAISIYNMLGQQVKVIKLDNPTVGKHEIPWISTVNKGLFVYKLEIRIGGQQFVSPLKKMIVL